MYRASQLSTRRKIGIISPLIIIALLAACSAVTSTPAPETLTPEAPATSEVAPLLTEAASLAVQAAAKATAAAARSTLEAAPPPTPPPTTQPTFTLAPTGTPPPTATPLSTIAPTSTALAALTVRVTSSTLNMRAGPGTGFPQQGQVRKGEQMAVLERNAAGDWIRVRTEGGMEGWVSAGLTDLGGAAASVPLAQNLPPAPTAAPAAAGSKGMIAFKSDRGGIWVMNADGSNQRRLANPSIYTNALRQGGPEYCGRSGLYCVKADWGDSSMDVWLEDREFHTGWRRIVSNSNVDWDPRMNPDSWWVVFVTNRNGNDELWLINREAREERRLTINDWEWDKHPSWSPDGKKIVFFSNRITGRRQIWVLDPWAPLKPNVNPRNLSNNKYVDYEPVWLK
jgi:uncharacterized protein YraI